VLTGKFAAMAARKSMTNQKPQENEKAAPAEEYDDEDESD